MFIMERVRLSNDIKNFTPLGAILREARVSKDRSVRGVARSAGISAAYLSALEHGINPKTGKASIPSPEVRDRLFSVLGITTGLNPSSFSIRELDIMSAYEKEKAISIVRDGLFDVDGPNNEFNYYIALANLYGSAAVVMQTIISELDENIQELKTKYHIEEDQVMNKPEGERIFNKDPQV
jgi:transcriptional regulator with XRE-family HTH domain